MTTAILTIGDGAPIKGFRFLWLRYVRRFNTKAHCATCLVGQRCAHVKPTMVTGAPIVLDETSNFRFGYLCGVTHRGWMYNLHVPFVVVPGERVDVTAPSDPNLRIQIENARMLPIPPLPDGFFGLNKSFTTCRNFQFAVAYLSAT